MQKRKQLPKNVKNHSHLDSPPTKYTILFLLQFMTWLFLEYCVGTYFVESNI